MLFCNNCGKELPNQANFCWNCGKPQKQGLQADEPKWETCEITFDWLGGSGRDFLFRRGFFVAKAMGPNGVYEVARIQAQKGVDSVEVEASEMHPIPNPKKSTRETFEVLISQLMKDSWEPTGRGHLWFAQQFRRRVK